jgi:ubiquinone/menaquinone biosynthesis C-methylase UbiE
VFEIKFHVANMSFQKDPEKSESKSLHRLVDFAGKGVLEIGCGEGRLTWRYAGSARRVTGIDPDRDSLRVAYYDMPADLREKTNLLCASALELPFADGTFDIALFSWSL